MAETSGTTNRAARIELDERVAHELRDLLPLVAGRTITAITAEVPSYSGTLTGQMRDKIENAVQIALGTFLQLVEQSRTADRPQASDPSTPLVPALEAAYALGSGEARSGRSVDALLAAYRVGARVSWREMAAATVAIGLPAATVAEFAELMFAYIDELSAASVAGHADELASVGRARRRNLERLTQQLLLGEPEEVLQRSAKRADWPVPQTLTVALLPQAKLRGALALLDEHTLESSEEMPAGEPGEETAVLLVPDMHGDRRRQLARVLQGRRAVLGPARPWSRACSSYRRVVRVVALGITRPADGEPLDTDQHLSELLLSADVEALADLRTRVLQPLAELPAATAERLTETLRSWLLHQGRRDDVAADLFVHPQTVRYRMGQLRQLYGERLTDPRSLLDLTVALALPVGIPPASIAPAG
ncbi:PucR C-terminal helix-turn-helix domain-containing protein [Micromonospora phaseoli]|uniref:PucR C-terminal helix-turn-helix domain-containing protein n=1 Tax=Micromonospora phaseoli TaxID=1144548 RepID=A0A1H6UGC3_9ACTN|nr:helix-turn-helix domain-containing protein [Micromonospora phaseoli]PZV98985.1 PucR-like helix-turn-helix protein [Micromonospora phaseoli]GIJ76264.1 Fis family transcriptional regulator [Micromonospora phaseoli]SEI90696.1 PucR C-terminal helix-turn-helix domain-containing protein [Micromonospora phaseoli]